MYIDAGEPDVMAEKVLIIEDIEEMGELIALYLKKEGFTVSRTDSAEKGLLIVEKEDFDLVVLDLNLPGMDGLSFLSHFREERDVPVLIVSARSEDEDLVKGLSIGADEYMTKPFSPRVLTARVKALLRRVNWHEKHILAFGDFTLNSESYVLKKGSNRIPMPNREFETLLLLLSHPGKIMTPEEIYNKVWGNQFGDLTTVAVHIQRIRKKIEEDYSNPYFIQTVHGKGYYFNAEALKGE